MTYIHFIVNPISGSGKHNLTASSIRNYFPRSQFRIEVDYTTHKGHATALATAASLKNPDCIVACGGDGTINEVASRVVGTGISLGIVPVGSGNGLAAHLGIPKRIDAAFDVIKNAKVSTIDVGRVNGLFFFSNMGIGVDAKIIKRYEKSGKRTLSTYVKAALSASFSYTGKPMIVTADNESWSLKPYLLFISNSNEMGYSMSLTPNASLKDGLLDLMIINDISLPKQMLLGYRVLRNQIGKFKSARHSLVKKVEIEIPDATFVDAQVDGEFHYLKTNVLNISVIENGLRVVTL